MGGVKGRYPKGTWLAASLFVLAAALFSFNAAANPGTYRATFSSPLQGIIYLFLANLPIDAFLLATAMYSVCRACGPDGGRTSKKTSVFLARVLAASLVVAIVGALIDFYAFYGKISSDGYTFWPSKSHAFFGSTEFFLALVGIFVSIYAATSLLVGLNWRLSILPAITITALNPLAWIVITSDSRSLALLIALLFALFAFASFIALAHWHIHAFEDDGRSGHHVHGQGEESRG